ncbi:hypothetical protein [Sphingomonas lenta]|uniref:hypothetical protein n=1 Tax=Sphingomonas lenta TaxID=1141887 RepID=UPI0015961352|nr:hypothetical protein [Sphingomonas lenta]
MSAAMLAGCGQQQEQGAAEDVLATQPPSRGSAGGVTRTEVSPSPTPSPAPLASVIQEQPGPEGSRVALNRAAVTGDVMTVQLSFSGGTSCCGYIPVDRVSVIDDATAQQIGVLKDGQGRWLAAPLGSNDKEIRVETNESAPQIVWFKFPAPPPTSRTVSINIPGVGPFDGIPVTR